MKIVKVSILINSIFNLNNFLIIILFYNGYDNSFIALWLFSPFIFVLVTTILLATDVRPEYKMFKKQAITGFIIRILTIPSVLVVLGGIHDENKVIFAFSMSIFIVFVLSDLFISILIYKKSGYFLLEHQDYEEGRFLSAIRNTEHLFLIAQDKTRLKKTQEMVKSDTLLGLCLASMYITSRTELSQILSNLFITLSILLYIIIIKINYRIIIYIYGELNKKKFIINLVSGIVALIYTYILALHNKDIISFGFILSFILCYPILHTTRMVAVKNLQNIENQ